jgi:hypothetical protein
VGAINCLRGPENDVEIHLCQGMTACDRCWWVQVLNETHSEGLRQALSRPGSAVDDAAFISIDRLGADVRVRRATDYIVERLTFPTVSASSSCSGL